LVSGLLTPVTQLNAQNPVRAAQTEQTSEGTQDDDKYMTLTCVVKNETEPTSERRYNFIAYSTDKETGEKKILYLANKDPPKKLTNQSMNNIIDKNDTIILKIEKTERNMENYNNKGGLFIGFENIQSINGFEVDQGKYQSEK
jgi:hypothetical protein